MTSLPCYAGDRLSMILAPRTSEYYCGYMYTFDPKSLLEAKGLRTTRQRRAIAKLLFADQKDRHVTAECIAEALREQGIRFALGTVYNTLHSFVDAGLLREVSGVEKGTIVFDTNTSEHHHFYDEGTKTLTDIPTGSIELSQLPNAPDGKSIAGYDVIIRLK